MLQLRNSSPFVATIFTCPDLCGRDTLVVVIKATFELELELGGALLLAPEQRPLVFADEYWGEASASSLRYPSEIHLPKPGADVLVLGPACAPRTHTVTELDVAVRVGEQSTQLRVYGDRVWSWGLTAIEPGPPQPFVLMPLVYERAYGGRAQDHRGALHEEARNPVGAGLLGPRHPDELLGQRVPNLDDPQHPLTALGQTPAPVGLAAIAPSWAPRRSWAGTYDRRWRSERAPYLPKDFDPRFFQSASPGLRFDRPLVGGEPVVLLGLHPSGRRDFALPRCQLNVCARVAGASQVLAPVLDTVVLETDAQRLSMVWRASLVVGEQLLRVERVEVGLDRLEGARNPTGGQHG